MEKFLHNEFNIDELLRGKTEKISSMSGEEYLEHIGEINSMIDTINKSNSDAYRKATFCSIG